MFDLIVVGCGFCGSVVARLAAENMGKKVLILEKRNHVAGNMYDEFDNNGILIQRYGPHIFHTEEDWIYEFVTRFGNWYPYKVKYGVELDGRCIPAPFGFRAIDMFYGKENASDLKKRLVASYPERCSVPILELMENSDEVISGFAKMLYEKNYKSYAIKQWNLNPMELDKSVIGRMPVIFSDRDFYFDVKYEMLPEKGFTAFFKNMLKHENIILRLNTDASSVINFDFKKGKCVFEGKEVSLPIVYTGPLEAIFSDKNHSQPYRSLYFEYEEMDKKSYQPVGIMTYPQRNSYLRTTEFSKFMPDFHKNKTVVAFEYPVPYKSGAAKGGEPYYPILTPENINRNENYVRDLKMIPQVYPCGRLADYKYYNMDQAIIRAFEIFHAVSAKYWG